jgi:hypothetical protein
MKKPYNASATTEARRETEDAPSAHREEGVRAGTRSGVGAGDVLVALLEDALRDATDYVVNYSAGRGAE